MGHKKLSTRMGCLLSKSRFSVFNGGGARAKRKYEERPMKVVSTLCVLIIGAFALMADAEAGYLTRQNCGPTKNWQRNWHGLTGYCAPLGSVQSSFRKQVCRAGYNWKR